MRGEEAGRAELFECVETSSSSSAIDPSPCSISFDGSVVPEVSNDVGSGGTDERLRGGTELLETEACRCIDTDFTDCFGGEM